MVIIIIYSFILKTGWDNFQLLLICPHLKETLRTDDLNLAYERANKILKELQIIDRPKPEKVLVGVDAYSSSYTDMLK